MYLTEQLREALLSGEYPLGAALSQSELARAYNVSRIPVRDALLELAADRLVEVTPGKGARVIALTRGELAEVFDLRILLETDLLRRSVICANDQQRAETEYALKRSSLEAGRPGWHKGDWEFHLALYAPTGRFRQIGIVDHLRKICVMHAARYTFLAEATDKWLEDHRIIQRAFVERRAEEACERLMAHLQSAHDMLQSAISDGAAG
tara:strand:+ start:67992 stop:68615 length:624 start_codon:yes stop_codon:yes gene_type:complete